MPTKQSLFLPQALHTFGSQPFTGARNQQGPPQKAFLPSSAGAGAIQQHAALHILQQEPNQTTITVIFIVCIFKFCPLKLLHSKKGKKQCQRETKTIGLGRKYSLKKRLFSQKKKTIVFFFSSPNSWFSINIH